MRNTSTYIWRTISILLFLSCVSFSEAKQKQKGKPEATLYGMTVGVDLLNPFLHVFNNDRFGVSADLQFDLWHYLYPTIVVGYDKYDASDEYAYPIEANGNTYTVNGMYFKVGALYNIWKKDFKKPLNPIGYLGFNFGCSPKYRYEIANYPLSNYYWNSKAENVFSNSGNTSSVWGEFIFGVKAPIVRGLCLEFQAIYKFALHIKDQKDGDYIVHQSYSPGFGDKNSGKWGFRYTISYFIPTVKGKLNPYATDDR